MQNQKPGSAFFLLYQPALRSLLGLRSLGEVDGAVELSELVPIYEILK